MRGEMVGLAKWIATPSEESLAPGKKQNVIRMIN